MRLSRRSGRPRKPEGEVLKLAPTSRMAPGEIEQLKVEAEAAGENLSAFVRKCTLRGLAYYQRRRKLKEGEAK